MPEDAALRARVRDAKQAMSNTKLSCATLAFLCVSTEAAGQTEWWPALPARRGGHAMAFDHARARAVLFGGGGEAGVPLDDTWEMR